MSLPETGYGSSLVQALPARNKVSNILCFKFFTLHFLIHDCVAVHTKRLVSMVAYRTVMWSTTASGVAPARPKC